MNCANCGAPQPGPFCGTCGQSDRNYQQALGPLLADLLRENFELDSRLVRTFSLLLRKPGELAVEFSRNRRASYVSPWRLYLFISIAFFFLLSWTTEIPTLPDERPVVAAELEALSSTDSRRLIALLEEAQRQKARELLDRPDTSVARLVLLQLASGLQAEAQAQAQAQARTQARTQAQALDSTANAPGQNPEAVERETGAPDQVTLFLIGKLIDVLYEPGSALNQLMDNLPVAVFLLLPVYALLLKLFYFGRRRYYLENLVFAVHLHTFAFLLFTIMLVLPDPAGADIGAVIAGLAENGLWLLLLAYHYLALRRYYEGSRAETALKLTGLTSLYLLLLMPVAASTLLVFTLATI
jgi:hypothetical protein